MKKNNLKMIMIITKQMLMMLLQIQKEGKKLAKKNISNPLLQVVIDTGHSIKKNEGIYDRQMTTVVEWFS